MNTASQSHFRSPGLIESILIYIAVIVTLAPLATLFQNGGLF
jgi:hypothetical protein